MQRTPVRCWRCLCFRTSTFSDNDDGSAHCSSDAEQRVIDMSTSSSH